jgi:chloramphenicol-sensitive protein RarD
MSDKAQTESQRGLVIAAGAYAFWGVVAIYFKLVGFADAREVLAQRILWSIPAALVALVATGALTRALGALRPRTLGWLGLSALCLLGNWCLFVWAVANDRIIETSLAYFLVPLANAAIGRFFFADRVNRAQAAALAIAAFGVILQAIALGAVPLVALGICLSWTGYGIVRKRTPVESGAGLLIECLWLAPAAIALLIWTAQAGPLAIAGSGEHALLLALLGPVTAAPLIALAYGARRVSFTTLGVLQFLAPSLAFFVGLAYGEPVSPLRWASFLFIAVALSLFTWDAARRSRIA